MAQFLHATQQVLPASTPQVLRHRESETMARVIRYEKRSIPENENFKERFAKYVQYMKEGPPPPPFATHATPRTVKVEVIKYTVGSENATEKTKDQWWERRVHSRRTTRYEIRPDTGEEQKANIIEDVFYSVEKAVVVCEGNMTMEVELTPKMIYAVMSRHVEFIG